MPTDPLMMRIASLARTYRESQVSLRAQLEKQYRDTLQSQYTELGTEIARAYGAGYSKSAIARAYTAPGFTPNRVKIGEFLDEFEHLIRTSITTDVYPFRWENRTVSTGQGSRVVYDLVAEFHEFGPDSLVGTYRWAVIDGELEPLYNDGDLTTGMIYPTKIAYAQPLEEWMSMNPQPEARDIPREEFEEEGPMIRSEGWWQ